MAMDNDMLARVEHPAAFAVFYMQCLLSLEDSDLLAQVTERLTKLGRVIEMQRARMMAKIVRDRKPTTPDAFAGVVVDCANLAFADSGIIGLLRTETIRKGETRVFLIFQAR